MDRDLQITSLTSIFRGASFFTVGKVLYNFLQFLFNLVLTRGLGVELYGIYAFANTLIGAAITVTTVGSDKAVLRYIPSSDTNDEQQGVLTFALLMSFLGSIVLGSLIFSSASLISRHTLNNPSLTLALQILAGLVVARALLKVLSSAFRALDFPEYDVLIEQIIRPVFVLFAVGTILHLGYSLIGSILAIVFSSLCVLAVALTLLYTKTELRILGRFSRNEAIEYAQFSLPLTIKDAGSFLYTRADVLMVGYFLLPEIVGIYNISALLATIVVLPLSALNRIFPSVASQLYENGQRTELNSVYSMVTRWAFTVSLPIAIFGIVLGNDLLSVFGSGFSTGEYILTLFLFGQLMNAAVGPSGYLLMMTGHQYIVSLNQLVFGIVNILLNFLFIIEFGAIGAAAATATILAALNLVRLAEVWKYERMFPYSHKFVKPLLAISVAGITVLACRQYLDGLFLVFGGGMLGLLVYFTFLIALGVEDDDIQFIKQYTQ